MGVVRNCGVWKRFSRFKTEGNTSQRSAAAIKRLAELMDHDNRVQRLKEGNLNSLATTRRS